MNITYYCPNNYSKSIDVLYDHCHLSHNDFFQSKYIRQLQNLNAKTYAIFNQLRTVLQTLKRNNIQIISSEQQSSFDKCIVLLNDSLAIKAARQIPNFYQSHVVENVLNKSKLSAFLKDNTKLKTLVLSSTKLYSGQQTRGHRHAGQEEIYFFVQGWGKMIVGNEDTEPFDVGPGDIVLIPDGEFHRVINDGEMHMIFNCVFNGARNH